LLDEVPGFFVADLWLEATLNRRVALRLAVENLLDRDYETFGVLGDATGVLGDDFDDPRFTSPGAPLSVSAGIDVALGPR
ncbi:MAG: hypothetical protein R3190_15700, partial [Thermoanaerobaculia bacterium]|nr:hypothetical protein [Thermoanaerobaculia bacterium]